VSIGAFSFKNNSFRSAMGGLLLTICSPIHAAVLRTVPFQLDNKATSGRDTLELRRVSSSTKIERVNFSGGLDPKTMTIAIRFSEPKARVRLLLTAAAHLDSSTPSGVDAFVLDQRFADRTVGVTISAGNRRAESLASFSIKEASGLPSDWRRFFEVTLTKSRLIELLVGHRTGPNAVDPAVFVTAESAVQEPIILALAKSCGLRDLGRAKDRPRFAGKVGGWALTVGLNQFSEGSNRKPILSFCWTGPGAKY